MAIFFNPDTGYIKKSLETIIEEKASRFSDSISEPVDSSPGSGFSVLNDPSSLIDGQVNQQFGVLLTEIADFFTRTAKQISTPGASTFEAFVTNIFSFIPNLEFISIDSGQGQVSIYLIFNNGFSDTDYPFQIWQGIHTLLPLGTSTNGTTALSYSASNGQIITYGYSLGTRLYVYIIVQYFIDSENYIVGNVNASITSLYQSIIETKYNKISLSLDFQDFVQSTYQIKGIARTDFYYYISTDPTLNVNDINISDCSVNINYETAVSNALIFNFSGQYILVNRTTNPIGPPPTQGSFS